MAALENLEFPTWSCKTKEASLNGRIFNGAIGFTVFPADRSQGNKPLVKINLDRNGHGFIALMDIIGDLQKSPLGTKIPMSKTKWNPMTKQSSNEWIITLEKDSEMCYWINLSDCVTGGTFRFPISASRNILIGNEPPTKSSQSAMGMKLFVNWLKMAAQYAPMTATKGNFQIKSNGGAGGGYQPRPAGGNTPQTAAVAPQVASDSEDMPF